MRELRPSRIRRIVDPADFVIGVVIALKTIGFRGAIYFTYYYATRNLIARDE
jgi:hypothetical protein